MDLILLSRSGLILGRVAADYLQVRATLGHDLLRQLLLNLVLVLLSLIGLRRIPHNFLSFVKILRVLVLPLALICYCRRTEQVLWEWSRQVHLSFYLLWLGDSELLSIGIIASYYSCHLPVQRIVLLVGACVVRAVGMWLSADTLSLFAFHFSMRVEVEIEGLLHFVCR